ncbi:MAG: Gmad2 immunoglobulin-like domain-containing protein [Anaerolineales bacterium]
MSETTNPESGDSHPKWLTYVLIGVIVILVLLVIGSFTGLIGGTGGAPPATEAPVEPLPTEAPPEATEPAAPTATVTEPETEMIFTIIQPGNGTAWNLVEPIQVSGSASGMPNDKVLIFAVDQDLNIYGETTATLGAPDANGLSTYSGTLWASAAVETEGKIVAGGLYDDGSIAGSAGVFVTMIPGPIYIEITDPAEGSTIADPSAFTVSGTGAGLPENNVVVQATSSDGTVLAEATTTVNTSELGGAGDWSVQLSVSVPAGTTGRIIAFSPDPNTGGYVATDQINVVYGQPQ